MAAFSIPLQVEHPEFQTMAQAQAKVLGLKQLAGAVAAQKQAAQLNDLRLQQEQLDIKDAEIKAEEAAASRRERDAFSKIYVENGGDLKKSIEALKINPHADIRAPFMMGLDEALTQQANQDLTNRRNSMLLKDTELEGQMKRHEEFGKSIRAIYEAPPEQRAAMLESEIKRNLDMGTITPDEAKQAATWDVSDDAGLLAHEQHFRGLAKVQAEEKTRRAEVAQRSKEDAEAIQTAHADAAREFGTVTDEESYQAWRNALPEKVGGKDFRRKYPLKMDTKLPNGETVSQWVARLGRTPAQQVQYEIGMKVKPDMAKDERELAITAARGQAKGATPEEQREGQIAQSALDKLANHQKKTATSKEAETEEKDKKKRFTELQKQVDTLQKEKNRLSAENTALGTQMQQDSDELNKLLKIPVAQRTDADNKRINTLQDKKNAAQAKITQNNALFEGHNSQQQIAQTEKDGIFEAKPELPPVPKGIPDGARKQYSEARKAWRYSTDGGKTWQVLPQK